MSKITLDLQLRSRLNGLDSPLEFCDEDGTTVGHYLPEPLYRAFLVAWSKANLSEEELQRRRQEPRGQTLAEIWQTLRKP